MMNNRVTLFEGLSNLLASRKGTMTLLTQAMGIFVAWRTGVPAEQLLQFLFGTQALHVGAQGFADGLIRKPAVTIKTPGVELSAPETQSSTGHAVRSSVILVALIGSLLLFTSCQGSLITGRVSTTGNAEIATDFENLVVVSRGQGTVLVREKQSGLPVWGLVYEADRLYIARWVEPRASVVLDLGQPVPSEYAEIVRAVLTPAEIEAIGITFVAPFEQ